MRKMEMQQVGRRWSRKIVDILGEDGVASDEQGGLGQAFVAAVNPKLAHTARWKSPFGRRDVTNPNAAEEGASERSDRDVGAKSL